MSDKSILKFYLYASSLINILLVICLMCLCGCAKKEIRIDPLLICELETKCLSHPETREVLIVGDMGASIGSFQINLDGALADWNKYQAKF